MREEQVAHSLSFDRKSGVGFQQHMGQVPFARDPSHPASAGRSVAETDDRRRAVQQVALGQFARDDKRVVRRAGIGPQGTGHFASIGAAAFQYDLIPLQQRAAPESHQFGPSVAHPRESHLARERQTSPFDGLPSRIARIHDMVDNAAVRYAEAHRASFQTLNTYVFDGRRRFERFVHRGEQARQRRGPLAAQQKNGHSKPVQERVVLLRPPKRHGIPRKHLRARQTGNMRPHRHG